MGDDAGGTVHLCVSAAVPALRGNRLLRLDPGNRQHAVANQRLPAQHRLLDPGACIDQQAARGSRLRPREQQVGASEHPGRDTPFDVGDQAVYGGDTPVRRRLVQTRERQRPQGLANPPGDLQPGVDQRGLAAGAFVARQLLAQRALSGQPQRQPDLELHLVAAQVSVGTVAAQAGTDHRRAREQPRRRRTAGVHLVCARVEGTQDRVQPRGTIDRGAQRTKPIGGGRRHRGHRGGQGNDQHGNRAVAHGREDALHTPVRR